MASRVRIGLSLIFALTAGGGQACTCAKGSSATDAAVASEDGGAAATPAAAPPLAGPAGGLSAPIAAAHGDDGEVVVAGLDVPAGAIRVQRINAKDEVIHDKTVLPGVRWSSESELKLVPAAAGVAVVWRGLRDGKLVRQLLVLGRDLAAKGDAVDVPAASCATHDAFWFSDGKTVGMRPWVGAPSRGELPKDKDPALLCGKHRAFAFLDEDDGTSVMMLGADAGAASKPSALSLLKESDFGADEQRERAEFTVDDDVGVVRLAVSGTLTLREVKAGTPAPMRKLKTLVPREDDVVAVDASPKTIAVIFTEEIEGGCSKGGDGTASGASVRVNALRVDRTTFEESVVELAPGICGREVGPFFTAAVGDAISVSWVERVPLAGKPRAPISALVHRAVGSGPLGALARDEQPADALVDAGCDASRCYAVALARRAGMDAMVPGLARVIRY